MNQEKFVWRIAAVAATIVMLAGCLPEDNTESIGLSGNVGAAPVLSAEVSVYSNEGEKLAVTESNQSADYSAEIETLSIDYPLLLGATGGIDLITGLPPEFVMTSAAVTKSGGSIANINPYSTLIVAIANAMPGDFGANIDAATRAVVTEFNGGLTSLASTSPIFTAINDTNRAEAVRGFEALAQVLIRINNSLIAVDGVSSIDSVVQALASDLVDGRLDGVGGENTSDRLSALAMIVNGQVALEILSNDLHIDGQSATEALDSVINGLVATPSTSPTGELPITESLLAAALGSVDAAIALESSAELEALRTALGTLEPETDSAIAATVLNADAPTTLEASLTRVARGQKDDIDKVNNSYRSQFKGNTPPEDPAPTDANSAPTLSGTPARTAIVGEAYAFTPTAVDADNDALIFSIDGQPTWTRFDAAMGSLTGTPGPDDIGTQSGITVTATDGIASATIGPFRITVEAPAPAPTPNTPPLISGTPATTVSEGSSYQFTPKADDADGDELSFAIVNQPDWLIFNAGTGALAGIPGASDVGVHSGIVISVTDRVDSAALPAFSITVEAAPAPVPLPPDPEPVPEPDTVPEPNVNSAPTISGTPPSSVIENDDYFFAPAAGDPDGDDLTFGIVNKPAWASFDTRSGVLSGRPGATDVGPHTDIVIYVSDGVATDELRAFTINVQGLVVGAASLSWQPPTENADGTPLFDLAGFNVYWGTEPDRLAHSVAIDNPGIASYVVEGLTTGTYYFTVTAFNGSGTESDWSNIATKAIE